MGTSQSSNGPGGNSPLVPPWADDQPQQPVPPAQNRRFAPFREAIGKSVQGGGGQRQQLQKALGHYARKATGGSTVAARRMGSVTQAGGALFNLLSGTPTGTGQTINLQNLAGLPCDQAIASIVDSLGTDDGDSEKIRAAMNHALVEALNGVVDFDPNNITDDVLVTTMLEYLAESIFLQIVHDAGKAWNKADTQTQALQAEISLKALIKAVVDKNMAPKLAGNIRSFSKEQIVQIERESIIESWKEWEDYQ